MVGKKVYVQFMLEGAAEVFGFNFDEVAATGNGTTSIGPSNDGVVLPPRHDYLMAQNPPFVKSVRNSRPVEISDHRLGKIRTGYRLSDTWPPR